MKKNMEGVFEIKLCRPLDPTEFQKRFWSDFAPIFEPFRDQFVAIWAPPELSWARPGGASSPLWHPLGSKGSRRARFQFQRAHFELPWTPKGANLTPKGGPNELQTCFKNSSQHCLVPDIDY